nr:hypothetical protein [Tanacetum cinerariifolium]
MFTHDPRSANMLKGFEYPNLQGRVNSLGSSIFAGVTKILLLGLESVPLTSRFTGRRFNLCDFYGTQKSTEHIVKPSELTPCVSPGTNATLSMKLTLDPLELSPSVSSHPSSTITMVSRFSDHSLSDRNASPLVHLSPSALHNILWKVCRQKTTVPTCVDYLISMQTEI